MKFLKLEVENFLTIGSARLNLDDKGLCLIQGDNQDDTSATSNGAGKSSIADALCWCCYGITARKVTGNTVVNNVTGKNCRVSTWVQDGDTVYEIDRYRKDSTHKNGLYVFSLSLEDYKRLPHSASEATPLTAGTDKLTQELVNKIMGCSADVFTAAVYAGQEAMPDLPGMTDKFLKMLVEEAAGIDRLQRAHKLATDKHKEANERLRKATTERDSRVLCLTLIKEDLDRAKLDKTNWETEREENIAIKNEQAKGLLVEAKKIEAMPSKGDPAVIAEMITNLDEKLTGRKREEEELANLNAAAAACERDLVGAKHNVKAGLDRVAEAKSRLINVASLEGTNCGECGKVYAGEDLEEATAQVRKTLRASIVSTQTHKEKLATLEKAFQSASDKAAKFKASMTDVSKVVNEQKILRDNLREVEEANRRVDALKARAMMLIEQKKELRDAANPFDAKIEDVKARQKRHKVVLKEAEEKLKQADESLAIATSVVEVFGPGGVRAHILDTVTPYLNDRTAHYLGTLSDGNISAVWDTLSKTAKGELREKFTIEVNNDKGADNFMGLSGGEKRKVRLATSMALQDLVASRASKPIDLYMADEIDHALDDAALERLMGVLDEKARERGTVLVISHNSLADWVKDVATVTKSGGISTIEGVLTA